MRAGEGGAAIRGIANTVVVDILGCIERRLVVAGHLHGGFRADTAGEIDGRRGSIEDVTPVVEPLQERGPGPVTDGSRPRIDVRAEASVRTRTGPVPVDGPLGRDQGPCARAE